MSKAASLGEYGGVLVSSSPWPTPVVADNGSMALPATVGHASAMIIAVEFIVGFDMLRNEPGGSSLGHDDALEVDRAIRQRARQARQNFSSFCALENSKRVKLCVRLEYDDTMTGYIGSRGGTRRRTRGEVNEIKKALDQLCSKDGRRPEVVKSKRECFQKLIKYMTTGIDMSALFVPAMKCCALSKADLPLKKMLYLYLRSTARQNSSVSLLVVQTFLNDANDVDPRIRGLAVRSMCSLRVAELLESVLPVVSKGLKDPHAYVRETSVIGVLKCYEQDEEKTVSLGLIDDVKVLATTERDTQVITSCLYVLRELGALHCLSRQRMISFMNNVRSFSEWGQCLLMETLLEHYRPETEAERFDVLEVLDFGLNHTNSAVIMATAKLFLHYTANYKDQYDQVIRLILGPIRTLIMGREPEVAYAVLCNVQVLAARQPEPFRVMVSDIFYRPEDTRYLKIAKLDLMVALSCLENAFDTAEESFEYARDFDDAVASHAVACISRIAIKVGSVDGILDRLLLFLNHRRQVIVGETVIAFAAALHKFPGAADICVPSISRVQYASIESSDARAAYIWVLGHFGQLVQDAPYILEGISDEADVDRGDALEDDQGSGQDATSKVKHAILTAAVELFCIRPPECLPLVKGVLGRALKDPDHILREKASLYAKLLEGVGVDGTRELIRLPASSDAGDGAAEASQELQDILFDELNTLSVVYGEPSSTFIAEESKIKRSFSNESLGGGDVPIEDIEDQGIDSLIDVGGGMGDLGNGTSNPGEFSFVPSEAVAAEQTDTSEAVPIPKSAFAPPSSLIDDFELLMGNADGSNASNLSPPTMPTSYELQSIGGMHIGQEAFREQWTELQGHSLQSTSQLGSSPTDLDRHIEQANLKCIGKSPTRYFFYGRSIDGCIVLTCVTLSNTQASVDIRSQNPGLAASVKDTIDTLLCVL